MSAMFADWNIEETTGYKPKTTFYMDFSIADAFGVKAIEDTYKRAMKEWKKNYEFLTELVMALKWKIWQHYDEGNMQYAKLYDKLYHEADHYACENLNGEELSYFFRTTY